MSAARRSSLLAVTFVVLALNLAPNKRAHAQPIRVQPVQPGFRPADPQAGKHTIWNHELSPEQIRALLSKFGQDDGKNDWFEQMLRDTVQKQNPNADPKQVDAAIKRLLADKEFMNRMMDLAQKRKNQMPNNGAGGPPPKLSPEDLEKLAKLKPETPDGNPFKVPDQPVPKFDPNRFPKFDLKKFDIDKNTGFPLDPKTGRPFDPRTGQPIDPDNPPKIGPNEPKPDPNAVPKGASQSKPPEPPKFIDPNTGRPVEQPNNPDGKRKFDPDNPLGTPNESPERIAKNKAVETATALWEKNVGPIEESPDVKRAIIDLVSDTDVMDALTDSKGNNLFDLLQGDDGDKLGNLFGDSGGNSGWSGWDLPKFDFGWTRGRDTDFDTGSRRSRERSYEPRASGGAPSLSGFEFGSIHVPWIVLFVLLLLIVAAVMWWKWGDIIRPKSVVAPAGGPGAWPIDPRAINTREDVVKAFEYLSVLICGPGAKTWTHSTIAEELTALAATHGETAIKLARLYELARYAPLDEPLTRAELLEARRLVCDLAGMDE
jgi:hypothetical protein